MAPGITVDSRETSMKLKILAIVALGVVGIGAAFLALGGLPASTATTTQYLTGTVATGDVTNDVAATGTMAAAASYGMSFGSPAHLAGTAAAGGSTTWSVTDVKVKAGDAVNKDQVLAIAETTDLKRQLTNATTAVDTAKIELRLAKASLSDAEDADVTAQIRRAKISVNNATTQLRSAQNTRSDLIEMIKLATLTAPIDGVVTRVNIVAGLDAPTGDAIVIDSADLEVTADVVETDIPSMAVGQAATVSIGAVDASLTGTVSAIAPTAADASSNGSVVSFPVTVVVKGAPATVRPGMTANITITTASAIGVATVPAAALRGATGNYTVLVMGPTGEPTAVPVQVGLVTNTTAEVESGLTVGQEVVTGINTPQTGTAATTGGFGGGFGGPIPGVGGGGTRRGTGN